MKCDQISNRHEKKTRASTHTSSTNFFEVWIQDTNLHSRSVIADGRLISVAFPYFVTFPDELIHLRMDSLPKICTGIIVGYDIYNGCKKQKSEKVEWS